MQDGVQRQPSPAWAEHAQRHRSESGSALLREDGGSSREGEGNGHNFVDGRDDASSARGSASSPSHGSNGRDGYWPSMKDSRSPRPTYTSSYDSQYSQQMLHEQERAAFMKAAPFQPSGTYPTGPLDVRGAGASADFDRSRSSASDRASATSGPNDAASSFSFISDNASSRSFVSPAPPSLYVEGAPREQGFQHFATLNGWNSADQAEDRRIGGRRSPLDMPRPNMPERAAINPAPRFGQQELYRQWAQSQSQSPAPLLDGHEFPGPSFDGVDGWIAEHSERRALPRPQSGASVRSDGFSHSFGPPSSHGISHVGGPMHQSGFPGQPQVPHPPRPLSGAAAAAAGQEFSIFVGDLSPDLREEDLVTQFLQPPPWPASHPFALAHQQMQGNSAPPIRIGPAPFASTKSAKIMTDPLTGASRGFGFVRFSHQADCARALVEMQGVIITPANGLFNGRPLRVCTATPKNRNPPSGPGGATDSHPDAPAAMFQGQNGPTPGMPQGGPYGPGATPRARKQHAPQQQSLSILAQAGIPPSTSPVSPLGGVPNSFGNGVSTAQLYASDPARSLSPGAQQPNVHPNMHLLHAQALARQGDRHGLQDGNLPHGLTHLQVPPLGTSASGLPHSAPAAFSPPGISQPPPSAGPPPPSGALPSNSSAADPNNTTVFVGGLSSLISEDTLKTFFVPFGEITYVKIPPGKGCGFVQFVRKVDAERAIERMQGFPIGGGRIRLSWGRSQGDKAAAAAAQAAAQAAQLGHLAGLAGLGGLNAAQLAQLASLSSALNAVQGSARAGGLGAGLDTNSNLIRQLAAATSDLRQDSGNPKLGQGIDGFGPNASALGQLEGLNAISGLPDAAHQQQLGALPGLGSPNPEHGTGTGADLTSAFASLNLNRNALQAQGLRDSAGNQVGAPSFGGFGDPGSQSDGAPSQRPSSYSLLNHSAFSPFSPAISPVVGGQTPLPEQRTATASPSSEREQPRQSRSQPDGLAQGPGGNDPSSGQSGNERAFLDMARHSGAQNSWNGTTQDCNPGGNRGAPADGPDLRSRLLAGQMNISDMFAIQTSGGMPSRDELLRMLSQQQQQQQQMRNGPGDLDGFAMSSSLPRSGPAPPISHPSGALPAFLRTPAPGNPISNGSVPGFGGPGPSFNSMSSLAAPHDAFAPGPRSF